MSNAINRITCIFYNNNSMVHQYSPLKSLILCLITLQVAMTVEYYV
jgi:hypothetical protein